MGQTVKGNSDVTVAAQGRMVRAQVYTRVGDAKLRPLDPLLRPRDDHHDPTPATISITGRIEIQAGRVHENELWRQGFFHGLHRAGSGGSRGRGEAEARRGRAVRFRFSAAR